MNSPSLVLASASPRRRDLLAEHGYRAEIIPAPVEESDASWLTVPELVLLNAKRKSAALWTIRPHTVVLGVDTLVCRDGKALGKPPDLAGAAAMLASLTGRTHQVYSGVFLAHPEQGRCVSFVEETSVTFLPLGTEEIEAYLRLINPLDKAGGYAAQEHGEKIIASYDGSWTNILGLPMERLMQVLNDHYGIAPS